MIGNDVIDLALARKESNWQRKGFLEKIFTEAEQFLIRNSHTPELLVWNLWSRKEAAYKIFNRETGLRAFIPKELECTNLSDTEGVVVCKGNYYYTKTILKEDFLHTIAVTDTNLLNLVIPVEDNQTIVKKAGIPFLQKSNSSELQPISISHHGRYYQAVTLKNNSDLF